MMNEIPIFDHVCLPDVYPVPFQDIKSLSRRNLLRVIPIR